jgi:putative flippase GtrA
MRYAAMVETGDPHSSGSLDDVGYGTKADQRELSAIHPHLRTLYARHGNKLRYLLVGVWNTIFFVALFNAVLFLTGPAYYLPVFWGAWVVGVAQSTIAIKYLAFRSPGPLRHQLWKGYLVYAPVQALASLLLWLGVEVAHLSPRLVQLALIVLQTILTYLGHKYFTFRRPRSRV